MIVADTEGGGFHCRVVIGAVWEESWLTWLLLVVDGTEAALFEYVV